MSEDTLSLVGVFGDKFVVRDLAARDKKSVIKEMLQHLVSLDMLGEDAARKAERAVQKREAVGSTGIGKGLAIPHAKDCAFVDEVIGVFGRSVEGVPFDAVDGGLVHVLFLVLSPKGKATEHLDIMKRIALLHRDEKTLRYIAQDAELASLQVIFREADDEFR